MAVIMIATAPGADRAFVDGLVAAEVPKAMAEAPGFVSHVSGVDGSGFRVIEVWETKEDHQAWFDGTISPNLPPDIGPISVDYVDLALTVPSD